MQYDVSTCLQPSRARFCEAVGRPVAVRLIFDLFGVWKSKFHGMPWFFPMEIEKIKIRSLRPRADAILISNQDFKNQVSAETLEFFQVGIQEIKFARIAFSILARRGQAWSFDINQYLEYQKLRSFAGFLLPGNQRNQSGHNAGGEGADAAAESFFAKRTKEKRRSI